MGELKWFLIFFILLYVAWLLVGGPNASDRNDQFLHAPSPIENGQTYNIDQYKVENPGVFGR